MAVDDGCEVQALLHILPAWANTVDGQKSAMIMRMSPIYQHAYYTYAMQDWSVCWRKAVYLAHWTYLIGHQKNIRNKSVGKNLTMFS